MKTCDVCGLKTGSLIELLETHKTPEIQEICPDCEKVLNAHKSKLQHVTANLLLDWFKRFMEQRKANLKGDKIERRQEMTDRDLMQQAADAWQTSSYGQPSHHKY